MEAMPAPTAAPSHPWPYLHHSGAGSTRLHAHSTFHKLPCQTFNPSLCVLTHTSAITGMQPPHGGLCMQGSRVVGLVGFLRKQGSTSDGTDPGCPWGRGLPKLVGEEEASVAVEGGWGRLKVWELGVREGAEL